MSAIFDRLTHLFEQGHSAATPGLLTRFTVQPPTPHAAGRR